MLTDTSTDDSLPSIIPPEKSITDEFYFESDSYALQQNKDYHKLMRVFVKLNAQKIQAVKGLEQIHGTKQSILKDTFSFVNSLQNGDDLKLPNPIAITEVPEINWEKYDMKFVPEIYRPSTRLNRKGSNGLPTCSNKSGEKYIEADKKRSETFRMHWSLEEHGKLEELLIKYPEERFAFRRYVKIAQELGTRTPLQVQSHVQKFFKFLKNQGLPVSGSQPKTATCYPRSWSKKKAFQNLTSSKFNKTFDLDASSPSPSIPYSPEISAADQYFKSNYLAHGPNESEDEEDILDEVKDCPEYVELLALKKVKKLKLEELKTGEIIHHFFKCDGCSVNPITGTRFHCLDCPDDPGLDLCGDCAKHFSSNSHLSSHIMRPIKSLSLKETVAVAKS